VPTTHVGSVLRHFNGLPVVCCASSKHGIEESVQGVTDRSFIVPALSGEQTAPDEHVDLSLAQLDD
jgi:hypothetical protein